MASALSVEHKLMLTHLMCLDIDKIPDVTVKAVGQAAFTMCCDQFQLGLVTNPPILQPV